MRRSAFVVALLLPLPFAALPLISLFFSPSSGPELAPTGLTTSTESSAPAPATLREAPAAAPLAYDRDEVLGTDCGSHDLAIEG